MIQAVGTNIETERRRGTASSFDKYNEPWHLASQENYRGKGRG